MKEKYFSKGYSIVISLLALLLFILILVVHVKIYVSIKLIIGVFTINSLYIIMKIFLSLCYRPVKELAPHLEECKISIIIPSYNEDESVIAKCFDSLLRQTYPINEVIFIDDGSTKSTTYDTLKESYTSQFLDKNIRIIFHQFAKNLGKKAAQAWGFKKSTSDFLMLVDSDSIFHTNMLEELMKPFADEKVGAVVGHIRPSNYAKNFITRIQDIGYMGAFRLGRAAQSVFNNVVVCSGACSVHRAHYVLENLDEFLEEKIFNITCVSGDDRCLTDFAIRSGYKTQYQATAICETAVPESLGVLFKQRIRWEKSSYLLGFKSIITYGWKKPLYLLFLLGETFIWMMNITFALAMLIVFPQEITFELISGMVIYYLLINWLTALYYTQKNIGIYLVSFIPAIFYGIFLQVVRLYSIVTLSKSGWNTR